MPDQLWGPIDVANWRETPVTLGRVATEQDVDQGRAAFYLPSETSQPHDLPLPAPAIVREEGVGEPTLVKRLVDALEDPLA